MKFKLSLFNRSITSCLRGFVVILLFLPLLAAAQQSVDRNGITLQITPDLFPHLVEVGEPFSITVEFSADNGQPLFGRWFKDNSSASLSGNRTGDILVALDETGQTLRFDSVSSTDDADYYYAASTTAFSSLLEAITSGNAFITNSIGLVTPDHLADADPSWQRYLEGTGAAPNLYPDATNVPEPCAFAYLLGASLALGTRRIGRMSALI